MDLNQFLEVADSLVLEELMQYISQEDRLSLAQTSTACRWTVR